MAALLYLELDDRIANHFKALYLTLLEAEGFVDSSGLQPLVIIVASLCQTKLHIRCHWGRKSENVGHPGTKIPAL